MAENSGIWLSKTKNRFTFALSDLPPEVRRAVIERNITAAGLPLGTHDEAAHQDHAQATPKIRDVAERKAAIARDLMTLGAGVTWAEKVAILRGRHGGEGTSKASLGRISTAVEGVDPVNFAQALLADCSRDGAPKVAMSDAA
jgi:putative transposase